MTKLVMGHIVCMGPNDEEAIPYDEAVIHIENDEDSEIRVNCPGALRLAPLVVEAFNSSGVMREALLMAEDVLKAVQRAYNVSDSPVINLALGQIKAALDPVGQQPERGK